MTSSVAAKCVSHSATVNGQLSNDSNSTTLSNKKAFIPNMAATALSVCTILLHSNVRVSIVGAQRRGRRALPLYKTESWNQTGREIGGSSSY